jgi:hypothetical protein
MYSIFFDFSTTPDSCNPEGMRGKIEFGEEQCVSMAQ